MSVVQIVSPTLHEAIAALMNEAARGDIVSIKAAIERVRVTAPNLRASDEELTEAILEVASAIGLFVCFDGRE
ncbi:hypothetical protein X759_12705 [Mesorhizobium sp. LSHC420B00]|nr:hypothetical protein X759_12705 [Mesorhizobium sp. LSHC420B00]